MLERPGAAEVARRGDAAAARRGGSSGERDVGHRYASADLMRRTIRKLIAETTAINRNNAQPIVAA